ncbi:MAG TPA: DUF3311 domain-containing protein [Ktedonobacteraceae bacterium]|jgi:hypothetical protein|nr:DUF3311 domain-containing protein [Ktedonobacteraceae bacterium]
MRRRTFKPHWFLLVVPYAWDILLIPWINTIHVHLFGIPFLFLWMLCGIVVTSLSIVIVYQLDKRFSSQ